MDLVAAGLGAVYYHAGTAVAWGPWSARSWHGRFLGLAGSHTLAQGLASWDLREESPELTKDWWRVGKKLGSATDHTNRV